MSKILIDEAVVRQAVSALEEAQTRDDSVEKWDRNEEAISALRKAQALAEQPAPVRQPVAKDAYEWGGRLNDASWAATEAWDANLMGPMSAAIFNNIKAVVREAILKYLDGNAAPQVTDGQIEAALKAAHMHSTPESRKDMRRAIEAAAPQPAQRKPLTDKQALDALDAAGVVMPERVTCAYELKIFRAAEAAHNIKP